RAARRALLHPGFEVIGGQAAALVGLEQADAVEQAVHEAEAEPGARRLAPRAVLVVEAARETETVADPRVGGEAVGLVARGAQHLCERREAPVVVGMLAMRAVARRVAAGEERGMRGQRPGGGRGGVEEHGPLARQRLELGRGRALVAVE